MEEVVIRLRISAQEAHYGGNLVDGARMLGLFGDVATELLIRDWTVTRVFSGLRFRRFPGPCNRRFH